MSCLVIVYSSAESWRTVWVGYCGVDAVVAVSTTVTFITDAFYIFCGLNSCLLWAPMSTASRFTAQMALVDHASRVLLFAGSSCSTLLELLLHIFEASLTTLAVVASVRRGANASTTAI
jgi:hypothetical protein